MSLNKPEETSVQNSRVTWEGCSVLLDINDGDRLVFSRLTAGSVVKIGNKNCSLKPLIGCAFGSLFQVENGNKGPYLSRLLPATEGHNIEETTSSQMKDELKDNRALVDNNTAQSLTGEDIDALRRQGATGDEIVEALIANSATFEKKTSFSQEKYRLKKQKKYAPKVLLRRPFARSICETYFKKYPERIGFLRVDTLSLLLSLANVTAHSDVLVVDMISGIITGAVAERLGGAGYVCNTYLGGTPYPIEIVRIFNFSNEICRRVVQSSLSDLSGGRNETSKQSGLVEDASGIDSQTTEKSLSPRSSHSVSMDETTVPNVNGLTKLNDETAALKASKAAKAGDKAPHEAINMWRENGFSSLIIAAPDMDAWSIVKEPLATCMHNLQLERMAIGLQISEPWLREYQILPSRSHPHMQMSSSGGYILSGTRICSSGTNQIK